MRNEGLRGMDIKQKLVKCNFSERKEGRMGESKVVGGRHYLLPFNI